MSMQRGVASVRALVVIEALGEGGTERSLADLLPRLVERGVEPVIATLRSRGDEGVEPELRRDGFDIRVLGAGSWAASARALADLTASVEPDLIHTMLYRATILGRIAGARHHVPVLTSLVNTVYASPPATVTAHRRKQELARAVDRASARTNAAFHAVSDAVRRDAIAGLRVDPDRVVVIQRGRDAARLGRPSSERRRAARAMLDLRAEQPVVVFVARHEAQKDHPAVLDAVAQILPAHPNLAVLMVGRDGPTTASIRAQCTALGLDDNVRWLGHRGDVAEVLAAADVFTLATHHEGMPGAAIEAMALGLPIVATDIPPVREVVEVGASALVYPDRDATALAAGLDRLLRDAALRERFGRRGRGIFEADFTMDASADRTAALYEAVAARRALPRWDRTPQGGGALHRTTPAGLTSALADAADDDWLLIGDRSAGPASPEDLAALTQAAQARLGADGDVGAVGSDRTWLYRARALRVAGAVEALREQPDVDLTRRIARWGYRAVDGEDPLELERLSAAAAGSAGVAMSVVIPTRNRATVVVETVRAVLKQDGPSFEVVVIDDGSTDETADALAALAAHDPRVRVVGQEHGGVSRARNTGLAAATGRSIVVLDDDDHPEPGWLAALSAPLERSDVGLVSCGCRFDRSDGRSWDRAPKRYALVDERALFIAGCYAFRRELLAATGGFDIAMVHGENTELGFRLVVACRARDLRVVGIDTPLVNAHIDVTRTRVRPKAGSVERVIERHANLFAAKPRSRSRWAAVGAVDAVRAGDHRAARRLLAGSVRHDPTYVRNVGRLVAACIPPLASRLWAPATGATDARGSAGADIW
jgi:glycosyltransferase involved in cell wall biosynthesis